MVDRPLEFLLFSDVAVVIAYVHLFTLFMIVPIFNSMARIDPAIIEAAVDAGANAWQVIREVVIPLSKSGIALVSIFVVTLVMGDFFVVRIMSAAERLRGARHVQRDCVLQYPPAAASAVVLMLLVMLMVAAILRLVDVRKELSG